MTKKVTVIGCGAWATTAGHIIALKGISTQILCHRQGVADEINSRTHSKLAGIELSEGLTATTDIQDALANAEAIIFCVASPYLKETCEKWAPYFDASIPVLSLTKGILSADCLFLTDFFQAQLPGIQLATLSGPNLATEVAQLNPTASVVAAKDEEIANFFQTLMSSDHFRIYTSSDYTGVLLGGILKNSFAIAAGAVDALQFGTNTRATLITRALQEMIRFGRFYGADEQTFYGLSGLGDLIATCSSTQSRNYSAGYQLGLGNALEKQSAVAEGLNTTKIVYELSKKHGIDMPIIGLLYQVLDNQCSIKDALSQLMSRRLKQE